MKRPVWYCKSNWWVMVQTRCTLDYSLTAKSYSALIRDILSSVLLNPLVYFWKLPNKKCHWRLLLVTMNEHQRQLWNKLASLQTQTFFPVSDSGILHLKLLQGASFKFSAVCFLKFHLSSKNLLHIFYFLVTICYGWISIFWRKRIWPPWFLNIAGFLFYWRK